MSVRKRPSRTPPARDVDATPFTPILDELLARIPGAYAAALVDGEGEAVDYAGIAAPFDVRVAAAHLQIMLRQVGDYGVLGSPRWIIVRGAKKTVVVHALPDGYALAVLLRRRAGFTASRRAFASCERALAKEAGWPEPEGRAWYAVDVEIDARGRPKRVVPNVELEVLGSVVGLSLRERGFRVRTADGIELTLVREARSCWYADEDLANARPGGPQGPRDPRSSP